jgi:uncharacterized protein (DUF1015 family)
MQLRAFRALRPVPELAARVVSPPYDVVSRSEAAALAAGEPMSFLHVVRSDIDLPEDVDPHDPRVYERARRNLDGLAADGVLVRDTDPALFVYREVMGARAQIGVVGCVSVADYERDVIRKHERTRPDKEDDRTRHILTLEAHAEPVLFAYRGSTEVDRLVAAAVKAPSLYDLTTADGVRHTVWRAPDAAALVDAFARVPCAYVADGHHRSAGARRAAAERRGRDPRGMDAEHEWFPAALCPADQLAILPYHRLVRDLGGLTAAEVLARLGRAGRLSPSAAAAPPRAGSFCIYLERRWHLLELAPDSVDRVDPLRSLDVWLLGERVLGPVLGITDQGTDARLDFVGGIRGTRVLEARVDAGEAALAVSMFPTSMEQLMAVADAGAIMPPKSTWFEPKLLSGFFVHPLD